MSILKPSSSHLAFLSLQVLLTLPVDLAALKTAKIGPPIAKLRTVDARLGDCASEAASVASRIYTKWADAAKAKATPQAAATKTAQTPSAIPSAGAAKPSGGGMAVDASSGPPAPPPLSAAAASSDTHGDTREKKKSRRSHDDDAVAGEKGSSSDGAKASRRGETHMYCYLFCFGVPFASLFLTLVLELMDPGGFNYTIFATTLLSQPAASRVSIVGSVLDWACR